MSQSDLYFRQMEIGPMQNFTYLIGDKKTGECLVVDPAWDVPSIIDVAAKDGMKVTGALVTHCHYDHVNGVIELLNRTDGRVYVHKQEASFIKKAHPGATGLFINISSPNLVAVDDGEVLNIGSTNIRFIHTPGHTPGSQCFLVENRLVSGDTLFIGDCGRCDLPGGDQDQMYESVTQKIMRLDNSIDLFPGHNYGGASASLGEQKQINPYMTARSREDFQNTYGY